MTVVMLVDALAAFIEEAVKEYRYKDAKGNEKTFDVHKFYLDAGDAYDPSITPYITVRPIEGTDEIQESTVKCALIIAVREEDSKYGHLALVNIIEHLRQKLLMQVSIGGKFSIKRPLKYMYDEAPNKPVYTGYIAVEFRVPKIDNFQQLGI